MVSDRSEAIHDLKTQLDQVRQDFRDFVQSPDVMEIFQPSEHQSNFISKQYMLLSISST